MLRPVPKLDLTDEEHAALIELLRDTIDRYRYRLSPRLTPIKTVLAKLQPAASKQRLPEPRPKAIAPRLTARKRSRW